MTLSIAALGVLLGALSLGWQVRTFALSGGRVKVELRVGAAHGSGSHMVTGPIRPATRGQAEALQSQGYVRPVVAVQVRNVGRLAVTVSGWSLVTSPGGTAFSPVGQSMGPPLPHRLEAGAEETWAVETAPIMAMIHATASVLKIPAEQMTVRGRISLGDGRNVETREGLSGGTAEF